MKNCTTCEHYTQTGNEIGLCSRYRFSVTTKEGEMVYRGALVKETDVCQYYDTKEKEDES